MRINYFVDPEVKEYIEINAKKNKVSQSVFLNNYLKKMIDYEEDLHFYNIAKAREDGEFVTFDEVLNSFGLTKEDLND